MENKNLKNLRKGLTHIGEINGHNYYTFQNFDGGCPMVRKDMFLIRNDERERFGIGREHMKAFCNVMNELVNNQNVAQIAQLSGHLDYLINLPINTNMLAYIAAPLVLIDDEPIKTIEPEYQALKLEQAQSHEAVNTFFLTCLNLLQISGIHTPNSKQLLESLTDPNNKMVEKRFYEMIGKKTITPQS